MVGDPKFLKERRTLFSESTKFCAVYDSRYIRIGNEFGAPGWPPQYLSYSACSFTLSVFSNTSPLNDRRHFRTILKLKKIFLQKIWQQNKNCKCMYNTLNLENKNFSTRGRANNTKRIKTYRFFSRGAIINLLVSPCDWEIDIMVACYYNSFFLEWGLRRHT